MTAGRRIQTTSQRRVFTPSTRPADRSSRRSTRERLLLEHLEDRKAPAVGLDPTFGVGGLASVPLDIARTQSYPAMAAMADGRFVTAGLLEQAGGQTTPIIARFLSDGRPDLSFSSDGLASVSFVATTSTVNRVNAVALQPDGKIVVAGAATTSGGAQQFFVARLEADGTQDTSFDFDGVFSGSFAPGNSFPNTARDLAVQPDGKIVVAGSLFLTVDQLHAGFGVARLNPNGSLDSTFDSDGLAVVDFGAPGDGPQTSAEAVALQPDGKIVLAGILDRPNNIDMVVVRLASNGSLDGDFGDAGIAPIAFDLGGGNADYASDVLVRPTGQILAIGSAEVSNSGDTDFAVAQLTSAGDLDTPFGNLPTRPGRATVDFGQGDTHIDAANVGALRTNGSLVLGGTVAAGTGAGAHFDFGIAQLDAVGALDTSFGTNGKSSVGFDGAVPTLDEIHGLALLSDGKILTSGILTDAPGANFASGGLARFSANGSLDQTFGDAGKLVISIAASRSQVQAMAQQADGKTLLASTFSYGTNSVITVTRVDTDGSLDHTFGSLGRGTAFAVFSGDGMEVSEAHAIAVQPDGHIVVVGSIRSAVGSSAAMAIVRLDSVGALDSTFSSDGLLPLDFNLGGSNDDVAYAVAIQAATGKILVGGSVDTATGPVFALARINADGSPDLPFGGGDGLVTITAPGLGFGAIRGFAQQTDGKIVAVGGAAATAGGAADFAVLRFTSEGALDSTFSSDGLTTIPFNLGGTGDDVAYAVAIDSQQRIVAAGDAAADASGHDLAVARLLADGSLDTTFSSDGLATLAINAGGSNDDHAAGLALLPDDSVTVVGSATRGGTAGTDFAFARLRADGLPDTTVGPGGRPYVLAGANLGGSNDDRAVGIALPSGKYLLAGSSASDLPPGGGVGTLARFTEDSTPPQPLGFSSISTPRNQPVSFVDLTFSEDLDPASFTLADLALTRNGSAVPLASPASISRIDVGVYRISGLASFTAADGDYSLSIQGSQVSDLAGNAGNGSADTGFQVDTIGPVAQSIASIASPRNTPVDSIDVTFNEAINAASFTLADLALTRNGVSVALAGSGTVSLINSVNHTYRITGLTAATTPVGSYILTVHGSGITDSLANAGSGDPSASFTVVSASGPLAQSIAPIDSPRNTPVDSIDVTFSKPIDTTSFTFADLALTRNGSAVPLASSGIATLVNPANHIYRITGLAPFTALDGSYTLTVDATGITDPTGNPGAGNPSVSFSIETVGPEVISITPVTPDPRNTAVASIDVTFSEAIDASTITSSDVTLTRNGANVAVGVLTGSLVNAATHTYRITGFSTSTGTDGTYVVTVQGAGITDLVGNAGSGSASDSFTVDKTGPAVDSVTQISPDARRGPDAVDVVFSEPINAASFSTADVFAFRANTNVQVAGVTITQVNPTTFRVSGLRAITKISGPYVLTVDVTAVTDLLGNAGTSSGSGSTVFTILDLLVEGDYDGDGQVDLATYQYDASRDVGIFRIRESRNGSPADRTVEIPNAGANSIPIPGDFDGDRKNDPALVNPLAIVGGGTTPNASRWILRLSSREGQTNQIRNVDFGAAGILDRPSPADFDGDGRTDIATFRADSDLVPGAAQWFILPSAPNPDFETLNGAYTVVFGAPGGVDLPAAFDFDGDGLADIATFRPKSDLIPGVAQWFVLPSGPNQPNFQPKVNAFLVTFGASGNADQPGVADWDNDGRDDITSFRSTSDLPPNQADWFILPSGPNQPNYVTNNGGQRVTFGAAGEIAAVGDYDRDGRPDMMTFNSTNGTWRFRSGTSGADQALVTFGGTGSNVVPVLAPLYFRLLATNNLSASSSAGGSGGLAAFAMSSGSGSSSGSAFASLANAQTSSTAAPTLSSTHSSTRKSSSPSLWDDLFDQAIDDLA